MPPNDAPWYETFFSQAYLDLYGTELASKETLRQVDFFVKALDLTPGESVLDVCAGQGRHAVPLAARGLSMTALDRSSDYLAVAADDALKAGVSIETVQSDMRDIPFEGRFDAVLSIGSSFGYFDAETDDQRVLDGIGRALKPGGRFIIDLQNREWVVNNQVSKNWNRQRDGALILENSRFDLLTGRNRESFTSIEPDGTRRELGGHDIRLYTLRELDHMLASAGLQLTATYGDYKGKSYDLTKRRMIVTAVTTG